MMVPTKTMHPLRMTVNAAEGGAVDDRTSKPNGSA